MQISFAQNLFTFISGRRNPLRLQLSGQSVRFLSGRPQVQPLPGAYFLAFNCFGLPCSWMFKFFQYFQKEMLISLQQHFLDSLCSRQNVRNTYIIQTECFISSCLDQVSKRLKLSSCLMKCFVSRSASYTDSNIMPILILCTDSVTVLDSNCLMDNFLQSSCLVNYFYPNMFISNQQQFFTISMLNRMFISLSTFVTNKGNTLSI